MIVFMLFSFFVADYSFTDYLIAFAVSVFDFVWFYSALSVMLLALTYGEDLVENEDRIASLEAQANIAQLNALRYQLNPHFLFNTLNSVASLISKKMGAEAETMVVSLSDFLRSTLRMDSGREITLAEEVKLQSLYLDIEKSAFSATAHRHHRRARGSARRLRAQSDHPAVDRECDQARRRAELGAGPSRSDRARYGRHALARDSRRWRQCAATRRRRGPRSGCATSPSG